MSLAAPGAASARPPVTTTGLPDTEITACACPARRSHERTMDVTTSTSRSDVRTRTSKPPTPAITSGRNTDRPPAARSPADDSSATEIAISSNHSTLTLRARPRTRAVPLTDPGETRVRPPAREGVESRPAPAAPPRSDFAADRLFRVRAGLAQTTPRLRGDPCRLPLPSGHNGQLVTGSAELFGSRSGYTRRPRPHGRDQCSECRSDLVRPRVLDARTLDLLRSKTKLSQLPRSIADHAGLSSRLFVNPQCSPVRSSSSAMSSKTPFELRASRSDPLILNQARSPHNLTGLGLFV